MITFVIPTLWRSEMIFDTIEQFKNIDDDTIEMVIIDNANSKYEFNDKRINHLKTKMNIFVNPAWNLGVALANNQHVCLLNDDIKLNLKLFYNAFKEQVVENNLDYGMIAINAVEFRFKEINKDDDVIVLDNLDIKGAGFGMFMITKRENYVNISPDLKVFFGDDVLWLVNHNLLKRKNYYFKGLNFDGSFSVTSNEIANDDLMQTENKIWEKEVETLKQKYIK